MLISTKWQIPNASQMEADLIEEKSKVSFLSTHQLINIKKNTRRHGRCALWIESLHFVFH